MRYLLGVDFGGGSSKATLINEKGEIIATSAEEYPMLHPHRGWSEQDTEDIYRAFVKNVRNILALSGVHPEDITAMGLDGGTHIAVLLDKQREVIRPAIYWADTRSTEEAAQLEALKGEIFALSYNLLTPTWTLPQMMWIRKNEPENFERIDKLIFLKDYIRLRLTGELVTDHIEAMGAMFRDEVAGDWSDRLLGMCGLRREQMPKVLNPADIVGTPTPKACAETGLSPKTRIIAGATDTAMEVYAAGCIHPGDTTIKLATAGRICSVTDKAYPHPQIFCYRHVIPGLWYPGTGTKSCAQSLRWYRDVLGQYEIEESKKLGLNAYELMDQAAAKVPAGADRLFYHPYLQGELTPYQNTKLRASFTGICSYHTKAHFDRAVMEGVAYSMRDCMQVVKELQMPVNTPLRVIGGGARSAVWRQTLADVLQLPLVRVTSDDSSIGSAMLAGIGAGIFASFEESVAICTRETGVVYPDEKNKKVYDEGFVAYKEIQAVLEPIYNRL